MTRLRAFGVDTFRSLRSRNFRLFLAGQGVAQIGLWMQLVALSYLMLRLTDSGVMLGVATAAQFGPVLLLGAWAGLLADRSDRQRLLVRLTVAGFLVATAFAALVLSDLVQVASALALAVVTGTIFALENPVRRSFMADVVDDGDITNAVALTSAVMTGSRVVGPAIAAALVAGPGIGWAFAAHAASFLPKLVLLTRMDRERFRPSERLVRGRGQLRDGLRYVWATPELRLPIVIVAVIGTLAFNNQVVLPLFAERDLAGDPGSFALLLSVMSLGSMTGALAMARRTEADTRFLIRSALGLGVSLGALAASPNLAVAFALALPVGVFGMFLISGSNAVVQLRAAPAMRGRALALITVVFIGSTPVGGPVVGWVAEAFGGRWGLAVGAAASAAAWLWALRALRRIDDAPPSDATRRAPVAVVSHTTR